MNLLHPTIKFDIQYSKEKMNFLDTTITITKENTLKTTKHSKQTDQKAYLHAKSYHPKCTKETISYSQALRIKCICSDESDYQYNSEKLLSELVERGYQTDTMKKNIEKANNVKREDLLNYKVKTPNTKIPLIVTCNKNLPKMKQIVDNTWNTLEINPDEAVKLEEKPIICYCRNRNLKGPYRLN